MLHELGTLTNAELCERLRDLVGRDNDITADIIECLAQMLERQLHLAMGFSSLHDFCVERFGFSHDVAWKRVRVARLATRHPEVIELLRQGRISVSGLVSIAPHADDRPDLIEKAVDKSSRAIEAMVAGEKPDALSPRGHSSAKPVGPQTFKLEVVVNEEQLEKIQAVRGLLRNRNPEGDLAAIIELAMDVLIAKIEKQKFSAGARPRRPGRAATTGVPAAVRREVYARDGGRCAYVGDDGRRCNSRESVEYDHIVPAAEGGPATVENGRLLCEPHNKFAARQHLGAARVEAAKARDHAAREARRIERLSEQPANDARPRDPGRDERISDCESALRNLGFSPGEARSATRRAANDHPDAKSIEALVRAALRVLVPSRAPVTPTSGGRAVRPC